MKLSVILSGIRPENWNRLYESIGQAFSGEFEFLIVSPYGLPEVLKDKNNIRIFEDFGPPTRCYQMALFHSTGDYIFWAADDGVCMPGSLDIAIKSLQGKDNTVVCGKYNEGAENPIMDGIEYYKMYNHDDSRLPFVPKDCLMLMVGVVPRDLMQAVGGFDTRWHTCPMAFLDLSIRLYRNKTEFIFQKEIIFKCSHLPGTQGDHGPIHDAQTMRDVPMFKMIYSDPESQTRIKIPLDNWVHAPKRWEKRFGV